MSTALEVIASSTGVTAEEVGEVLRGMIISGKNQHGATATNAEMTVVSSIFAKYDLNPFIREGHAFISGGKLQVIIGFDGFVKIMNRQPTFNGVEFEDKFEGGELISVTTKIHIKGRDFPVCTTEYMDEAYQPNSAAWKKFKKRMLRNKSLAQCIRIAFGVADVVDPDEADRIKAGEKDITPQQSRSVVDYQAIESQMSECATEDSLRQSCTGIREDFEKRGIWNAEKAIIIEMNGRHKARIAALNTNASGIDAEFEEVNEESHDDTAKQTAASTGDAIDGQATTVEFE